MAKNQKPREMRVRNVTPTVGATPTPTATPAQPVVRERRVKNVAPAPTVDLTTAPVPTSPAPAKSERRVKNVVPVAPATKKKTTGKSRATLGRYLATVELLDEYGPDVSEAIFDLVRPCFASLDDPSITLSLAVATNGIAKVVKNTGDPELDGEKFVIREGELFVVHHHATGGMSVYNVDTAEPVEMVMDAKAAVGLKHHTVPEEPAAFDQFIKWFAGHLEKLGAPIQWAK